MVMTISSLELNWSFGDYYKREAIEWAWELLTKVWGLPKERLFATVYTTDDEAAKIWRECTDIDPTHILKFESDNFWEMGDTGPCGPCSEIHYDYGDPATQEETMTDSVQGVNGSNERYVEIWNLVFMQNERMQDRSLQALSAKHVDTGAGLERICAILQSKNSNYETDLFMPITKQIAEMTKTPYSPCEKGVPHRVIADHIRALTFTIADGATPGNDGRGYVIRRILRRASRYAFNLGMKQPFLYKLSAIVVGEMRNAYPELEERCEFVQQVIKSEEKRFSYSSC